jgi:hypothetical protein
MNSAAKYWINLGNSATLWVSPTGTNKTMNWIYDWEFDIARYTQTNTTLIK